MPNLRTKKIERLKEVATELFTSRGYRSVTLDEIAQWTGISKMTIYKHYQSKEELFEEIIMDLINFHLNEMDEELNQRVRIVEKIEFIIDYDIKIFKSYPIIFFKDIMTLPFVMKKVLDVFEEKVNSLFINLINEGVMKGEIRQIDTEFVSELLTRLPILFQKEIMTADESKLSWIIYNLYDFIKYGLLGLKLKGDQ